MIRSFFYLLALGFILSSCGQKFSLQKRKYNKGFYFASGHNVNHSKSAKAVKTEKDVTELLASKAVKVEAEPDLMASASPEIRGINKPYLNIQENKINNSPAGNDAFKETQTDNNKKQIYQKKNLSSKTVSKKGPLGDFVVNAYIGYLVVSTIIAIVVIAIYLLAIYPLPIAIGLIVGFVILMALLAAIGGAVR